MSVFDRRPRAVLDSNVLGDLLKGGATLRDDFMRVAREGIAFHINNYVLDEICAAIVTNVLLPRDVATLLTELLDAEFPVLPYQRYLYGLAGFGGSPVGECVVHTRAMTDQYFEWRDLMAKTDRFDPALKSIASELAAQRVERRREYAVSLAPPVSWERTGNENDVAVRFEEALPEMRRRFDLEYGVEPKPPASVRCDAHIRSFTLLSLRQWYDGKPAGPHGEQLGYPAFGIPGNVAASARRLTASQASTRKKALVPLSVAFSGASQPTHSGGDAARPCP